MEASRKSPNYGSVLGSLGLSEFSSGARPLDVMPGQPGYGSGGLPNKLPGPAMDMQSRLAELLRNYPTTKYMGGDQSAFPQAAQPQAVAPSGAYGESAYWNRLSDAEKKADWLRGTPGVVQFLMPYLNDPNLSFDQMRKQYGGSPLLKGSFDYLDQPMWK